MRALSAPLDAQIEITEACNLRCSHCYNYWRTPDGCPADARLTCEQSLAIIEALARAGVFGITVTGGEPMLFPEVALAAIGAGDELGLNVGLNTNATTIDRTLAARLRSSGLRHALVSLLGTEGTHDRIAGRVGVWKRTCDGIACLVAEGIPVAVSHVVSRENSGEVGAVGEIAARLGVSTLCATPMTPSSRDQLGNALDAGGCMQMLDDLIEVGERYGIAVDTLEPLPFCMFSIPGDERFSRFFGNRLCGAGVSTCVVSSRGEVRPCIHADTSFGNMLTEDFVDVWARMDRWRCAAMLPAECQGCAAIGLCEGGCRMSGRVATGSYSDPDMYMRGPLASLILPAAVAEPNQPEVDPLATVHFGKDVRIRRESFGAVTYQSGHIEFFTDPGIAFLERLRSLSGTSVLSLCSELGRTMPEVLPALARLARAHLITINEPAERR